MAQTFRSQPQLTREEAARIEVGHTTVSTATARVLAGVFLVAIAAVPALELAGAGWFGLQTTAWTHLTGLPAEISARLAAPADGLPPTGAWTRLISANRTALAGLTAFEDTLEDESRLGRLLRPQAQRVLTGRLGAGNERAYIGRDGWLFYRFDVEHVTAPGFLLPAQLARRVAAADEWTEPPQPDPREAIRDFKRQLDTLGITLIVLPTPIKPTVHPGELSARLGDWPVPVHNSSYGRFLDDLRRDGILVFDPSDALVEARRTHGRPLYLATDTHWRPEAVVDVAEALGRFVWEHTFLPPIADQGFGTDSVEVAHEGDTLVMLDLPPGQQVYPPETVRIRRVLAADGTPWRPSRQADVMLLGDSFTNIYALGTLGWGDSAGLAEQLSYALNRPLDRLVQNDDGAFATRAMLARTAATDPDRLARTRVVIWQFAARELSFGDWQLIEMAGGQER